MGRPLDIFGQVDTNRAILIKVKNPGQLARSQGSIAALAAGLAPATIEAKVYDEMAKQLRQKLADQHVDADITVVEPTAWKPAGSSHVATDLAFAVGGAGVIGLLWWIFGGSRK